MSLVFDSDLPILSFNYNSLPSFFTQGPAILSSISMGGNNGGTRQRPSHGSGATTVTQALEIARDSEEGARDPIIVNVLENAVAAIWAKIQDQPQSYVMTRDEFAVFNYFQRRFEGYEVATAARKRYWDHLEVRNGA